jgi:hypothetical protein
MPIGIRCPDKPADRQQPIEIKGVTTSSVRNRKARYMGRQPELRILCGSL